MFRLFWGADAQSLTKSIVLKDLTSVRVGATTKAFAKLPAGQVDCAVTLVTPTRTLDLLAHTKQQRDDWILYFKQFVS